MVSESGRTGAATVESEIGLGTVTSEAAFPASSEGNESGGDWIGSNPGSGIGVRELGTGENAVEGEKDL